MRIFRTLHDRVQADGWYYSITAALPVAIVAYLIGLVLERPSGQFSTFDLYSYAGLAGAFILIELLLLTRRIDFRSAIYTIITLVCCQFTGKLIFLLYFNPRPENFHAELTETFFWMPAVYILASFIPGLNWGRAVSLIFFAVSSLVGLSHLVGQPWQGPAIGINYALIELGMANATMLILINIFIDFKESLAEQRSRARTMAKLAYSDSLTQLPNRLALEQTLTQLVAERSPSGRLAVFFLDIDGFKVINDSYGHAVGDELLRVVAQRLRRLARDETRVFRISGDEFVLIFPEIEFGSDVQAIGSRIKDSFSSPVALGERLVAISVSVGVALCPEDAEDAETLLRHADIAMYKVKKNGKNGVGRFCPKTDMNLGNRAGLAQELKQALLNAHEGLDLAYQPIFDARTGRVRKVEALLRWESQTQGAVSPGVFIPIAEECGLINPLGNWVLHTACHQASSWQVPGTDDLKVCINVSAEQFIQPDFVTSVEAALTSSGLPPERLELELTESVVIHAFDYIQSCLQRLRRLGVSIALDDFGTGYSSLSYLEELDFDTIKLDRSFANKIVKTRANPHYPLAIVRAVVEIADTLSVEVVAEGIETEEQLELLSGLGCTLMQGFYLARPMSAGDLVEVLPPVWQIETGRVAAPN